MTAAVTDASSVDTRSDEDEGVHAFCPHIELTLCGQDSRRYRVIPIPGSVDEICRVCLLAVEMWDASGPCPLCGCRECLE